MPTNTQNANWIPLIPMHNTLFNNKLLYLIIIIIFILGEDHSMRDRGSVWSLDQQQPQQQQSGHICIEFTTFYGIVSYAVGVSLILTISGIQSGRRFFLHRRHSGRHSGRRSAGHTLRDTPANHHHRQRQRQQQQQQQQRVLNGLDMDYSSDSDEFDRELEQLRDRIRTPSGGSCAF